MNINIKILTVLIALALLNSHAFAQKKGANSSQFKSAKKEYNDLKYAYAIPLLEQIIVAQPTHTTAMEMLANSYRKIKNYDKAAQWYAVLVKQANQKPAWALHYAEVLANVQDYKNAEIWYKKYLALAGTDTRALQLAKGYAAPTSFMANKNSWQIGFANINTAHAEYAPIFYNKGLAFVSNRKTDQLTSTVYGWDHTPFSDLYVVNDLSKIKPVNVDSVLLVVKNDKSLHKKLYIINNDDTRSTSNDSKTFIDGYPVIRDTLGIALDNEHIASRLHGHVNSKYHEGPMALLPDGTLMFTRNNYFNGKAKKSSDGIIKLKMFTTNINALDGVKPFAYNSNEYSVGHPAVNSTGTILIFASDMPGGFGGTDLYACTRAQTDQEWSQPVNMGKMINTEGDELFPTYFKDDKLYFSSTGHAGLGGLDIFETSLNGVNVVSNPINLGAPVNSSVDDFSLVRDAKGEKGFFASNRRGNDDIYTFSYKGYQILLKGVLVDNEQKPMPNINIVVKHDGQVKHIKTDDKGHYTYTLPKNTLTEFNFNVNGFKIQDINENTNNITTDTLFTRTVTLTKLPSAVVPNIPGKANPFVPDCEGGKKIVESYVIYYDLDKSNIRKDAEPTLKELVAFLKKYPQFDVAASSHTDSRASVAYNLKLSERRSKAAIQHLVKAGINVKRIKSTYYGKAKLVNHCGDNIDCPEHLQQLNRRTQFVIIYKDKNVLSIDCETLSKMK